YPGLSLRSNPGLKLANASGVIFKLRHYTKTVDWTGSSLYVLITICVLTLAQLYYLCNEYIRSTGLFEVALLGEIGCTAKSMVGAAANVCDGATARKGFFANSLLNLCTPMERCGIQHPDSPVSF